MTLPQLVQEVRESIVRIQMVGIGTKSEADKCAPLPRQCDRYFVPSPRKFIRPRLSDPDSFRGRAFDLSLRARDYQRPFERCECARRLQILAAQRCDAKVLTTKITLQ
jgi:hypothetical protein